MRFQDFAELLCQGAESLGVVLPEASALRLFDYFEELKRWNAKVNLIAKETSDQVIVEKHFLDSLVLTSLLDGNSDCLLDIGSGAGFPGLVVKIALPLMRTNLVEPRLKRVSFLRHIIRTCGLESIDVQACRLEAGVSIDRESEFTCIVSRAVTDISRFLQMCERFNQPGIKVFCMKGPKYREELSAAVDVLKSWKLEITREYTLPYSQSSRVLLQFERDGSM